MDGWKKAESVPSLGSTLYKCETLDVFNGFLDSGEKIICKDFGSKAEARKKAYTYRAYLKMHDFPIKAFMRGSCIYLERTD